MIQIIGKLKDIEKEYVGQKGFPVANLELDVNGRPLGVSAKGQTAERTDALLGEAPEDVLVEIYADTEYRESKDGRVFMDIVVSEAILLGNVGDPVASYKVQGFVEGVKEIEKKNGGSFYLGQVRELKFGRDGFLPGAILEVSLDDSAVSEWQAAEGQFVFVRGSVSGWKSQNGQGRIWPRFSADQASFMPVMGWLGEYAPGGEPAAEEDVLAEDAGEDDLLSGLDSL